jgi:hypothetical protein
MEQELKKNNDFDRSVPLAERQRLQRIVDHLLPSTLGRIPRMDEINDALTELQNGLRQYFTLMNKSIPSWLK